MRERQGGGAEEEKGQTRQERRAGDEACAEGESLKEQASRGGFLI